MRNEERASKRKEVLDEENPVLELPETKSKEFKFKSYFAGGLKKMKKIGTRNLVIVLSVVLIAAAVFVNWMVFGGNHDTKPTEGQIEDGTGNMGGTPVDKEKPENFFAASQIERKRARDEAIEVLQGVVDDAEALDVAKEQALSDIATIAGTIEMEANIESLIKAKGFEECVAVINGDKANIVVKSDGLKPNELSQIIEVVYLQANILPANITIAEK